MRCLSSLCTVLMLAGFATAQAVIVNGYATTSVSTYSLNSPPRLSTPSISLQSISPSPVGASNATYGNEAGARNSTLFSDSVSTSNVSAQPVWYGPNEGLVVMQAHPANSAPRNSDFGAASFQANQGLARIVAASGRAKKATHTYTNPDVEHVNDSNGTVKHAGKVEHIN